MLAHKVIFKGRLDFGSKEAVARIIKQLEPRIINLYKEDFPWKIEALFPEGTDEVRFHPVSQQIAERTWKHGLDALTWLGQYAICGEVIAIRLTPERSRHVIRPDGQKAAVLLYQHALEETCDTSKSKLIEQVIEKYSSHTEALMARADLAMNNDDFDLAARDLAVVAEKDPENPQLWLRQSRHDYHLGLWDQALIHIGKAISMSMPLEDIHWEGRMLKAKIHRSMGAMDSAFKEWNLVASKLEKTPDLLPGMLDKIREYRERYSQSDQETSLPITTTRREKVSV